MATAVAHAHPGIPRVGIRRKLNTTFVVAAKIAANSEI
jgi:hypothetical protein